MKFLVIEGLDGSGKSTQVRMLKNWLSEKKVPYEYLHFPRMNSPVFGELVARYLRGELGELETVNPYLVALLFAGDQKDAAGLIRKWQNESKFVLVDRYVYSNVAYQCAKFKNQDKRIELMNWIFKTEFEHFQVPVPDLSLFLNVPHNFIKSQLGENKREGADRKYLEGKQDIHESDLNFQMEVRKVYEMMLQKHDGLQELYCGDKTGNILPPDIIFNQLIERLQKENIL
ncbi:MAG: dTMP kinase [Bacteroidota bacterium]